MLHYFERGWSNDDTHDFIHAIQEHVEGYNTMGRETWNPKLPNTILITAGKRFGNAGTLHNGVVADHRNMLDHGVALIFNDGYAYMIDANKCKSKIYLNKKI